MKQKFPEWVKTLYRGLRAGVSAGLVAAWAIKPDWSKPEESLKIVGIAFGTAFVVAFAKWAREQLDSWFGWNEKSLVAKLMPI